MGYRQSRFDPDYSDPGSPPRGLNTPRKRIVAVTDVLVMLAIFAALSSGLINEQWFILSILWGCAIFAAVFGAIPGQMFFREDNPAFFRQVLAVGLIFAIILTCFILWIGPTG